MDDLNEIKKLISSILVSSPLQMTIQKLHKDFVDQMGYQIPFQKMGFNSLEHCLLAMPDILEVHGTGLHAEVIVHVSSKSAHIDKLIAHQKKNPPKKHHFGYRPKGTSRKSKVIPIVPNNQYDSKPMPEYRNPEKLHQQIYVPPFRRSPTMEVRFPGLSQQKLVQNSFSPFCRSPTVEVKTHPQKPVKNSSSTKKSCSPDIHSTLPSLMTFSVSHPGRSSTENFISFSPTENKPPFFASNLKSSSYYDTTKTHINSTVDKMPLNSEDVFLRCKSKEDYNSNNFSDYAEFTIDDSNNHNFPGYGALAIDKSATNRFLDSESFPINESNTKSFTDTGAVPKDDDIYSSDEEESLNLQVPLKVQQNLLLLIEKYEDGIWCAKIPQTYQKMFNKELDYAEYGYRSLIQMCMDLKNIFFWYRPDNGDFKLYDRTKPPPNDLDKHFKQSDVIKSYIYLNSQPSNEPAVADIEELINTPQEECYPPDVVHLMEDLPRQFLPDNQEDEFIDVCVGEVYDPSKFWLMLREFTPFLDQLMDDMQAFYSSCPELKVPSHMIKVGLYCAAVYNNEYHRAIIVNLMRTQRDRVKVFYVDYGTVSSTLIVKLHFLHKKFFDLPQQAIRARLARIYPPIANTMWPPESSSRYLDIIRMKNLVAHLYRIDRTQQILEVFLADTSGEDDIYINDMLVQEGHAIFTYEEQEQVPIDPRFTPIFKYLHLVPSFDHMEQGIVPNASEMIRLLKTGVAIEQILPQYFTQINVGDTQNVENDHEDSQATQQTHLNSLSDTRLVLDKELKSQEDGTKTSSVSHSDIVEVLPDRDSVSPEVMVVNKPTMRPPPGFEGIQAQKIEITATTQNVNGGNVVNTVLTQTTNIETTDTQNLINYLFNRGVLTNQQQIACMPPPGMMQNPGVMQNSGMMQQPEMMQPPGMMQASGMEPHIQHAGQNIINQLMLFRNQAPNNFPPPYTSNFQSSNQNFYAQPQMFHPDYQNTNFYNTAVPNQQYQYPQMPNMYHSNIAYNQPPFYNQGPSPLRSHLQELIKELLLVENKVMLNRFLYIIKKRFSSPGVNQVLFNLISDVIYKTVTYPQDKLHNIYNEALRLLNEEDIADLANEAKSCTTYAQPMSAGTQTSVPDPDQNHLCHKVEQLSIRDPSNTNPKVNDNLEHQIKCDTNKTELKTHNQTNQEMRKLVLEIEFQGHKIHLIWLENEAYTMVSEVLQLTDKKMPIELVRKCIVMTDPSISVTDIRLQDHKNLIKELSKYMYVDATYTLHVVPITFVPKLMDIIGNKKDLAFKFDNFLQTVYFRNSENSVS